MPSVCERPALELDSIDFSLTGSADIDSQIDGVREARAWKTTPRIEARFASSDNRLANILPPRIAPGESWHLLTSGDVDSLSFLRYLVDAAPMDYVLFSTWCMALPDIEQLSYWSFAGRIARVDAYVGEIFPGTYRPEHRRLCNVVRHTGGRVAVFRNHSKIILCRSGDDCWTVESSANMNTNPRTENAVITCDRGLYQHHKAYFDQIRSFARDFDDWEPAK